MEDGTFLKWRTRRRLSKTRTPPRKKPRLNTRAIAVRRVRLALVLAEIGDKSEVEWCTDDELNRAVMERARQFTGQEQRVWEYYQSNPQAVAALRAPLLRGKGGQFRARMGNVTEKKVTREELYQRKTNSTVS